MSSNSPATKKPNASASELEAEFEKAKAEIESKYAEKRKILDGQKAQEINELKDKHDRALGQLAQYEIKEKAGTLNEEYTCGTCGVKLDADPNDPEDLDFDKIQCCEKGGECGSGFHCNAHKSPTTTCTKCKCFYCKFCVGSIEKCAACWDCDMLTCGESCWRGLDTMPCGEMACKENDCNYYHYKRCNCEEEARDAGFARYKRKYGS